MTEDEYLESLAIYRAITDTGPTYSLREVTEHFGFDPDELAAEAEQEEL